MRIRKKWHVTRIAKWHKSPHNSTKAGRIGLKLYRIIEHKILSTFMRENEIRHFDDFLFICSVRHNLSTHQNTPFPKYGHILYLPYYLKFMRCYFQELRDLGGIWVAKYVTVYGKRGNFAVVMITRKMRERVACHVTNNFILLQ